MLQPLWAPSSPLMSRQPRGAGRGSLGPAGRDEGREELHPCCLPPRAERLSPGPGWSAAPLPLCRQRSLYRWQDRHACWCCKALPAPRRCHRGRFSMEGSPRAVLTSLISAPFQRLLERLGGRAVSTPGCHCPSILKLSPHTTCPAYEWFFYLISEQLFIYYSFTYPFLLI